MKKIEKESQQTITSLVTNSQIVMHAVTGFQKVSSCPPFIYHPRILELLFFQISLVSCYQSDKLVPLTQALFTHRCQCFVDDF